MSGVYAGGDLIRGPDIIIGACADGRRAAEAICQQLGIAFEPPATVLPMLAVDDVLQVKAVRAQRAPQHGPDMLPVSQRQGFACVEQLLSEEAARAEAKRCLQCSTVCDKCVEVCPNRANYTIQMAPVAWAVPVLALEDGTLVTTGEETFRIQQTRQIIHVDDFCNECGNCATFCVHQGKPYTDKPRLFLEEVGFEAEDDNAFLIKEYTIRRREGGVESRLSLQNGTLVYEDAYVRVKLTDSFHIEEMGLNQSFEGTRSLQGAAEMAAILKGVVQSAPFLLVDRN
jgi:putative selenate reductase